MPVWFQHRHELDQVPATLPASQIRQAGPASASPHSLLLIDASGIVMLELVASRSTSSFSVCRTLIPA